MPNSPTMLESFAMNRPFQGNEIETLLRSFSYADICQEISPASRESNLAESSSEGQRGSRMNERHPAFYAHIETPSVTFNPKQHHAILGGTGKEISKQTANVNDKRKRTLFTPMQLTRMEEEFRQNMYVVGLKRWRLASELCLTEKQIKIWFQNRRMKLKREQVKSRCLKTGFPWY